MTPVEMIVVGDLIGLTIVLLIAGVVDWIAGSRYKRMAEQERHRFTRPIYPKPN